MHARRSLGGFLVGLVAGAVLMATAAAADEPRPKAGNVQGHGASSHGTGGRWQAPHGADAAAHDEDHDAAPVAGPEVPFPGCAFYENAGFSGRRGEIRDGASVEWLGRSWSDRISSAVCHPGCRLIGYIDINFGGARRNFRGAVSDLGAGWNDRISALRAVCDGGSGAAESH